MSKQFERTANGSIRYRGEIFPGFNRPKKAPAGDAKKMVVLGKEGDKIRKVKFGQRGWSDYTKHKNPKRRANFRARHNCETAKDKTTARYWACKKLW